MNFLEYWKRGHLNFTFIAWSRSIFHEKYLYLNVYFIIYKSHISLCYFHEIGKLSAWLPSNDYLLFITNTFFEIFYVHNHDNCELSQIIMVLFYNRKPCDI